jgi:cellulose synthase/poly-beta-1,6-N-acetylglucosamine synthase-like glycosyltransferase
MELFPIQILFLVVLMNRYILGPLMRRFRGDQFDATNDDYEPTVAIIIPLFNEGEGIFHAINSLLMQDYPADKLSIVVVDDCSKDDSHAWALKAAEKHPNVLVLRNPENMGKRKGINRGVRATRSEIVVSVDSDVIVDRGAVRQLVRRFLHPRVAAVGGRTYVTNRHQTWLTRMVEIKFHFAQEWLKDLERGFRSVMCLSGCLTAYRRHVLEELEPILEARAIAGVAIKYGEDRFLTRQIIKAGYETIYTTAAVCFTASPAHLPGYFAQQLRWRRSNLVDMLGGLSHAWKLHPVVAVHYVSQFGLLLSYPVVIVHNVLTGEFWDILAMHVLAVGLMGFIYRWETRHLPEDWRVPGLSFLPMALLMPVTYALFTPLALLTLDSGSWETRGSPSTTPDTPVPPETSLLPTQTAGGLS